MEVNQQDFDGWTPLHAAAHWAQREACELLAENYVNMDIKNCVGQTPFDVADPDVLRLLEELKKKQNTLQKDRPDIKALINRPPTTPGINKGGRRSSITRLSQQDKETIKQQVKETIKEEKVTTSRDTNESDKDSSTDTSESAKASRTLDSPGVVVTDESGKEAPGFLPPHPESSQGKDDSAPWRRPGSLRARPTNSGLSGGKLSPSTEDLVTVRRAHSFGSDEKRKVSEDTITKQSPDLRPRSIENLSVSKAASGAQPQPAQVRRSSDISISSPSTVTSGPISSSDPTSTNTSPSLPTSPENGAPKEGQGITNMFKTFFKSFVPPVRDEEHEIQRKAHAKRVRETRRSTQGVTLEDLKSAEQLVKKKQQQENAQRTTELLAHANSDQVSNDPPGSTATTTVNTTATLVPADSEKSAERRPSWRLRIDSGERSRNIPTSSSLADK